MQVYKGLLSQFRKDPELLNRAAICAMEIGDVDKAKRLAEKSLRLLPSNALASSILGSISMKDRRYEEGISHFRQALKSTPDDAHLHLNLAVSLNRLLRSEEALPHVAQAASRQPTNGFAQYVLARTLEALGRLAPARQAYRRATGLDADNAVAWAGLVRVGEAGPEDTDRITAALDRAVDAKKKTTLHFALAELSETRCDYELACAHFVAANELFRSTYSYDVAEDISLMRSIVDVVTRERLGTLRVEGRSPVTPIFIVGVPRSGSTVIEQILSGHSRVAGGGELPSLNRAIDAVAARQGKPFPRAMELWDSKIVARMRDHYIADAGQYTDTRSCFTDKNLFNFMHVGLIVAAYPEAKIIHSTRDPVENCLSLFRVMFDSHVPFAYRIDEIVRYFKAYRDLMAHWDAVAGANILHVGLEDLSGNPETVARRILDFCDLPWEPSCLAIEQNRRSVHTMSALQVREPIGAVQSRRRQAYATIADEISRHLDS